MPRVLLDARGLWREMFVREAETEGRVWVRDKQTPARHFCLCRAA